MLAIRVGAGGKEKRAAGRSPESKTPLPRRGGAPVYELEPLSYCTFRAKSSTTKEVCSEESSAPTRKIWTV